MINLQNSKCRNKEGFMHMGKADYHFNVQSPLSMVMNHSKSTTVWELLADNIGGK